MLCTFCLTPERSHLYPLGQLICHILAVLRRFLAFDRKNHVKSSGNPKIALFIGSNTWHHSIQSEGRTLRLAMSPRVGLLGILGSALILVWSMDRS